MSVSTQLRLAVGGLLLTGCHLVFPFGEVPVKSDGTAEWGADAEMSTDLVDLAIPDGAPDGAPDLAGSCVGLGSHWAVRLGGAGSDEGRGVALDAQGNIYLVGSFEQSVDFGGGDLTSAGETDAFVASYAPNGCHRWSKRFGGFEIDRTNGVAIGLADEVYIVGTFSSEIDFGGGKLNSAGGADIFVASFSSVGKHLWSERFGSAKADEGHGVAVNAAGEVYVAGEFSEMVDLGGGSLTSAGGADIFVASFTSTGQHLWSMGLGGPKADRALSVAVDSIGNVYLGGEYTGTIVLGSDTHTASGLTDLLVVSLDPQNNAVRWSKAAGGTGWDSTRGVTVDLNGDVSVVGQFSGAVDLGGGQLPTSGNSEIFVASFASDGTHRWSKSFKSAPLADHGRAVAVDSVGNVTITGDVRAYGVNFGGGSLSSSPNQDFADIFVASFTAAGEHRWSELFGDEPKPAGATANPEHIGLAVAAGGGNVLLAGRFRYTVDLGWGKLSTTGLEDIFLAKLKDGP